LTTTAWMNDVSSPLKKIWNLSIKLLKIWLT